MDKGFSKIDLNQKTPVQQEVVDNNLNKKPVKARKKWPKIVGIILGILLIISVILFFPAKNLYAQAQKTNNSAQKVLEAIKNQNIEQAKTELITTKDNLSETKKAYSFFAFTKIIPVIGGYYKDGEHLFNAAEAGIDAGLISFEALIPYADLLGLKGGSTFVSGSADDRIQTAVKTLDKLTPKIGEIAQKVEIVQQNLDAINLEKYPQKVQDKEIRNRLIAFRETFNNLATLFINARPLLENLPSLLGQPEAKRYLVIFQNDKELRPTGGFITAYALFKVDKGKFIVEGSDDIYKLDERKTAKVSPPKQFIDHLKVYNLHLRDTNFDPDFIDSMKRFEEMYNGISGTSQVDGIVAVDTHVLVEAMKILGPIPAYGTNFTVDNDSRCDCPQVIYELEDYAGKRVAYVREERKDIIGVLLYQIMQKALGVSPSQYWGRLFQMVLSEFDQKHILAYLHNEPSQKSLEALNFSGKIISVDSSDYLHINDANLGGAKSNMFVKQTIKHEYSKDKDGSIIKTLTIDYKNPREGDKGCNLEAGGLCLNGLMPNWVRIYVPYGSELLEFQGSEDSPTTEEEYGKTVFEGFLTVKPASVTQIKVRYKLPSDLAPQGKKLPVYIQKQPGTEGHEMTLIVNGKEVNVFNLTQDLKLEVKL